MFAVVWREHALDEVADAMVRSDLPTQDLIEQQILKLNRKLAQDPLSEGESRIDNIRITFADPIGILFDVDSDDQVVTVLNFWTY